MYISTKTYGHEVGLSCCFRQWRASSHCRFFHGYALAVKVEFAADDLDGNNWVVDFGSLKAFKEWLQYMFDHKMIVARDDPHLDQIMMLQDTGLADIVLVDQTGCEAFAELIYDYAVRWLSMNLLDLRVRVAAVEVKEHGANSALFTPGRMDS